MSGDIVFDIEVYRDYFLVAFMNVKTESVRTFEMYPGHPLDIKTIHQILQSYRVIGFNSINYDLPILSLALAGASNEACKRVSDKIIQQNISARKLDIELVEVDHIDLIEVAGRYASLKVYGGRLHCQKLQDLPIEPGASINAANRELLSAYCVNDLIVTRELFLALEKQIELRESLSKQYGVDLRSKSDAQIAENVIRTEVRRLSGRRVEVPPDQIGECFKFNPPSFLAFNLPQLANAFKTICSAEFLIGDGGRVSTPKSIAALEITIGPTQYQFGIGGLHSMEKSTTHRTNDDFVLIDRDVTSYYPAIILNCGLRPAHLGQHFTDVYRSIVERRVTAKRTGDKTTADTLKITVNGSFGKFGSKWSVLYSPQLLIQTTITGQLSLLMLIEMLHLDGINVVSANTDGIVIKCPRDKVDVLERCIGLWEMITGFETEAIKYQALFSKDVNNYIAITDSGYKAKGVYAKPTLSKNPSNVIVNEAVINYLRYDIPIDKTIRDSSDIRKFLTLRKVTKGAFDQNNQPIGKAIRWYYSTNQTDGLKDYKGGLVARSMGAQPLMDLPGEFPIDLNFNWYIDEANKTLIEIGAKGQQHGDATLELDFEIPSDVSRRNREQLGCT